MTAPSMLRSDLRTRLTAALRERDRPAVAALRSVLAALENAEAVPADSARVDGSEHVAGAVLGVAAGEAARRVLTAAEERDVVDREIAEMLAGAESYDGLGESDRSDELRRVVAVISEVVSAAPE
jgi:uncharacterized protein